MKIFRCPVCDSKIFFENYSCHTCHTKLGFSLLDSEFVVIDPFRNAKYCVNEELKICNWVVNNAHTDALCTACAINRHVPGTHDKKNFNKWKHLEVAKHRLIYQLNKLELGLIPRNIDKENGLAFDFLIPENTKKRLTGHANGVVTIILSEADSVIREQLRKKMSEPYRTLIGHFRHEIGHYYWSLLFEYNLIDRYRFLFGDDREDYSKALKRYYKEGAPSNWNQNFISKYATAHSWEDWAETWAHYLHIMDILETAFFCKMSIDHRVHAHNSFRDTAIPEPYATQDFKILHEASVVLTVAVNSLNRSMGVPDIYPFTIPRPVVEKLTFIHDFLWKVRHTPHNY